MDNATIHDLKNRVRDIRIGVSLLPLGSVTPEMVAAVRECNENLAKLLGHNQPVTVISRKPTAAEIALHQAKLRLSGVAQGIEPIFSPTYVRRAKTE